MKKIKTGVALVAGLTIALGAGAAKIDADKSAELVGNANAPAFSQKAAQFTAGIRADAEVAELQRAQGDSDQAGYGLMAAKKKPPKKK